MNWTRFGNTFIAHDRDGYLYVVSLYSGGWHAYIENADGTPHEIGQYGYGPGEIGLRAAQEAAAEFAGAAA
jgi:hypothetical protein